MKSYEHLAAFAVEHPWNITRPMLQVIASILARRIVGQQTDPAVLEAALTNRKDLPQPRKGNVAVIPVYGVLAPRMNLLSEMSGGTTYQRLSSQLREAVADPKVKTIVLDVDSPGGSVAGNGELAAEIMRARTKKPIVAQAQFTMASAAYQLAAAATEIVAAPSARVGSIGTFTLHNDLSEALKAMGVTRTYIAAGDGKVDGNEAEPLSPDARARLQASVDDAYDSFVTTVVQGRGAGTTADRVRNEWKAYVYGAADAKRLGLIDRVATLDQTLARLLDIADADDPRAALTLTSPDDTSQTRVARSGQDRRADAEVERKTFEMLIGV